MVGSYLHVVAFWRRLLDDCRGAMGIAGGWWRVETRATPSVSFSNPPRKRAFCQDADRRFEKPTLFSKHPRSNGSAREPPEPHRLHPFPSP